MKLGEGEFGTVIQAQLFGLIPRSVAVKMVKGNFIQL